ncbi:MAG: MCE family protein [Rhodanobacteraceae bacterium]|nr:MAG: MCE family protein [Rhodanobacteraceae bacterium]
MENRAHAIVAVAFLLVFSLGAVVVYYWLANRQHEPLAYTIVTTESVGGLSPESEVRFKGLLVGHVDSIGFDPRDRARVVIRLRLRADTYVTQATYAEVAPQGLAGGSVLELKLGPGSRAPLATSSVRPARIPMRAGVLGLLVSDAPAVLQDLKRVLQSANEVLDQANRRHLAASLAQIDAATRRLTAIEARLPALIDGVQRSVAQSHALLADSDRLAREAQTPVRNAATLEASVQALAASSRQLSERLNRQSVPEFNALSESLQRTSRQLDQLLRELRARPQSVIFGPAQPPPGPGEPGFSGHQQEPQP